MKHGVAPPRPIPARKRTSSREWNDRASAVAKVNTPKAKVAITSMRLRPKRSASAPKLSAPSREPSRAAEKIGPMSA